MSQPSPTLHILCGKIASGKSTLAARLACADRTILIAEDAWLKALFPDGLRTGADYLRCSERLRSAMGPHVASLLTAGQSVVLDFPANTRDQRAWMRGILDVTGASHRLHLLEAPDDVCLARLRRRNERGDHPFAVTEAQFRRFTSHFVEPVPEERFDIVVHRQAG
jgi:predicted kinase